MKERMDTIRAEYASYDPIMITAGDFNCQVGTEPYNILASEDMVNAVYEITTDLTPARIDHILISENNVRASDKTFEYLPVVDEANEIPSDHAGLYTKMLGLVKSRIGGITGSNSGTVRSCVGQGTVAGSYNYGTLVGRNMAAVETSYYELQTNVSPLGITVETTAPSEITSNAATVYAMNTAAVFDRYTLTSGEIALTSMGEEVACVTDSGSNASHSYGSTTTVTSCVDGNYTIKTGSTCGYEYRTAVTDAVGHSYGALTTYNDEAHKRTCTVCGKVEYLDHSFTAEAVAATCEEKGYTRHACADCDYYYDMDYVDATGHTYVHNAEQMAYVCHCGGIYMTDGEPDSDGKATTADVILLLRRIDGWEGEIPNYKADVNGDGKIKIFDAVRFLQILNS